MSNSKKSDSREKYLSELGLNEGAAISMIREAIVSREFADHIGRRTILLMSAYPFMVVGTILEVVNDFVVINVEATNVAELDDEVFRVHLDNIEVFFIEDGRHKIPRLKDYTS